MFNSFSFPQSGHAQHPSHQQPHAPSHAPSHSHAAASGRPDRLTAGQHQQHQRPPMQQKAPQGGAPTSNDDRGICIAPKKVDAVAALVAALPCNLVPLNSLLEQCTGDPALVLPKLPSESSAIDSDQMNTLSVRQQQELDVSRYFFAATRPLHIKTSVALPASAAPSSILALCWTCDARQIITAHDDRTLRVWRVDRLARPQAQQSQSAVECVGIFKGHTEAIEHVIASPTNPHQFVTASSDRSLRQWDARYPTSLPLSSQQQQQPAHSSKRDSKSQQLAQQLKILSHTATQTCTGTLQHASLILSIAYSPDGRYVAMSDKHSNSIDQLSIIDSKSFKIINRKQFQFEINQVAFQTTDTPMHNTTSQQANNSSASQGKPNGASSSASHPLVLTTSHDSIEIYSVPLLVKLYTLQAHVSGVSCASWRNNTLVSGGVDAMCNVYACDEDLACQAVYADCEGSLQHASLSSQSRFVALACSGADAQQGIHVAEVAGSTGLGACARVGLLSSGGVPVRSLQWAPGPSRFWLAWTLADSGAKGAKRGELMLLGMLPQPANATASESVPDARVATASSRS